MTYISRIQDIYKEWQDRRLLRKHGCNSWEEYYHASDPDYDARARTVKLRFVGYPYVARVDYAKLPTRFEPMFGDIETCAPLLDWCKTNCKHKYRSEWERVIQDHFTGEYLPNSIGGSDELFFGFKDERDYIMFTLRWS